MHTHLYLLLVHPSLRPACTHSHKQSIDPGYDRSISAMAQFEKNMPILHALINDPTHCQDCTYFFSLLHCASTECKFCNPAAAAAINATANTPLDTIIRKTMPMPMLQENGHYPAYEEACKLPFTNEKDRPSLRGAAPKAQVQAQHAADKAKPKGIFDASKLKAIVTCDNCNRPRCVFMMKKATVAELDQLTAYIGEVSFSCGDDLFEGAEGDDAKMASVFFNKEELSCRDDVELAFFNPQGKAVQCEFEHVCARCGNGPDDSPFKDPKEFNTEGRRPLPLCTECHDKKTTPVLVGKANLVDAGAEQACECITATASAISQISHPAHGPARRQ